MIWVAGAKVVVGHWTRHVTDIQAAIEHKPVCHSTLTSVCVRAVCVVWGVVCVCLCCVCVCVCKRVESRGVQPSAYCIVCSVSCSAVQWPFCYYYFGNFYKTKAEATLLFCPGRWSPRLSHPTCHKPQWKLGLVANLESQSASAVHVFW